MAGAPSKHRIIAAGTIGNLLEWYDFAIYGYFAQSIGRTFFPSQDPVAQVLAAFGVFAVGYLVRPLGGAVVGHIGDRYGRRLALILSVSAMAVPTFLVGLLPGYATIGLMAPVLLTLLRTIQGLSVGGEWTTSFVFLIEHADPRRRGVTGAIASCGGIFGILTGSAVGALLAAVLPPEQLDAWGWRIPFLFGLIAGITGLLLRRGVGDAPGAVADRRPERSPLIETLRHHGALVARLAGVCIFCAISFYLIFLYLVSWLQTVDGVAPARSLAVNTTSMAAMIPVELLFGWLSDRVGRRPILLPALVFAFVAAVPLFWLMHHPEATYLFVGELGFVLALGAVLGVLPAFLVEMTTPALRCTTVSLGYNIALGLFGGMTPLAATWLVERTTMDLSPAFMIMAAALVSFVFMLGFAAPATDRAPAIA
jgi:MHS family proline/betaine transporter-like MFS transporter